MEPLYKLLIHVLELQSSLLYSRRLRVQGERLFGYRPREMSHRDMNIFLSENGDWDSGTIIPTNNESYCITSVKASNLESDRLARNDPSGTITLFLSVHIP